MDDENLWIFIKGVVNDVFIASISGSAVDKIYVDFCPQAYSG